MPLSLLKLPDLGSLTLFACSAEMGSLTRAADISCMSLAAASRRISQLEQQFQTQLLERTARGVEVTDAGRTLLAQTKELLMAVNRMQLEMSDYAAGQRGVVRLVATTSAMTHFLPADLASFLGLESDIQLSIGEGWSDEIARQVMAHRADIGVVVAGCNTGDLETRPYRSYRIGVVARPDHPIAGIGAPAYQDVLGAQIVSLEGQSLMMRALFEQAALAGRTLNLRVQVRSFEAVCRLVQAGLGVGLLPLEPAVGLAAEMGLVAMPLADAWAVRHMTLCFNPGRASGGAVARVIRHLAVPKPVDAGLRPAMSVGTPPLPGID